MLTFMPATALGCIPRGGEERSVEARGIKDAMGKLTQSTKLGSQGLTVIEQTTRGLHETGLGTLHICYSHVAWSSYGIPKSRNRGCL